MRTMLVLIVALGTTALAQQGRALRGEGAPVIERDNVSLPLPIDRGPRVAAALKTDVLGWAVEGAGYELRCDDVGTNCGAVLLRSQAWRQVKAGAFLHHESALPWRGTRVELRADLRTGRVDQHATLVVMAQDEQGKVLLSARSDTLSGTTPYTSKSVLMHVPEAAERLVFGVELVGPGGVFVRELWFDERP